LSAGELRTYFMFSFVRDPIEHFYSAYEQALKQKKRAVHDHDVCRSKAMLLTRMAGSNKTHNCVA
jgi:hypothetical protein